MDVTRSSHIILNKWHTFSIYVIWNWSSWFFILHAAILWMIDACLHSTCEWQSRERERERERDNPQLRFALLTDFYAMIKYVDVCSSFLRFPFIYFVVQMSAVHSAGMCFGGHCATCTKSSPSFDVSVCVCVCVFYRVILFTLSIYVCWRCIRHEIKWQQTLINEYTRTNVQCAQFSWDNRVFVQTPISTKRKMWHAT